MRMVKSTKAQSLCGVACKPGDVVRTTYAHARALQSQGLAMDAGEPPAKTKTKKAK